MKPRHQSNESTEEIRAGIEQTRAQMDGTIDELTERLKPRHILDDVLDYFQSRRENGAEDGQRVKEMAGHAKDSAAQAGKAIIRQVKKHPFPAMLIGAGIAWLLIEGDEDERSSKDGGYAELYTDDAAEEYYNEIGGPYSGTPVMSADEVGGSGPQSYALPSHYTGESESSSSGVMQNLKQKGAHLKEKGADLKARAGEAVRHARERTSEKAGMLREKAGEMGSQWKGQAHDVYHTGVDKFKTASDEHPLAVGVGFLALGVLAGMLLPSTRKENEYVGPARDRLVQRTREAAQDAVDRGKHVAQSVAQVAKEQAREQGLTPEALKEKGTRIVESVKNAAREEGLTPEGLKEKAQTVATKTKEAARDQSATQAEEFKANV